MKKRKNYKILFKNKEKNKMIDIMFKNLKNKQVGLICQNKFISTIKKFL